MQRGPGWRYDKDNFIKNLLLDNLLLVDIYNRAKKLHIETSVKRVVFLIETKNEKDVSALETVKGLFAGKKKDFITQVDEKNIILVREVAENESYEDMEKTAKVILDMLNTEAMTMVHVAYGTIVQEIKDVSRSYKEAKMALDVGKIFYSDRNVIAYSSLKWKTLHKSKQTFMVIISEPMFIYHSWIIIFIFT